MTGSPNDFPTKPRRAWVMSSLSIWGARSPLAQCLTCVPLCPSRLATVKANGGLSKGLGLPSPFLSCLLKPANPLTGPESQSPGLKELAALVGVVTLPQCHLPPASCLPVMLRTGGEPLVSWRSYASHRANDNHPPVGNTAPISHLNPHAKGRGSNRVS